MTDPRLDDFGYPGEPKPVGVIERSMSEETVAVINGIADNVRTSLDAFPGRRMDCRRACATWEKALQARGLIVGTVGGEGIDDDVMTSGYRLVPLDERSGYREGDNLVHRHYWLEIGPDRLIFDPTAQQFDDNGGVSLDRYTLGGQTLVALRSASRSG